MKREPDPVVGCSMAAVCFGIVSYGHFYRGRMEPGWTFILLTAAQFVLAVMRIPSYRKNR